jgi:hypothetical protein
MVAGRPIQFEPKRPTGARSCDVQGVCARTMYRHAHQCSRVCKCVAQKACKAKSRATLGAPFKFGAREHQTRTFGRNIAGRRVSLILSENLGKWL